MREKFLLIGAALVAFGLSLGGAFQFDDFALLSDPAVGSPSGWWESWGLEQTRPLTWFTFWINYEIGGERPLGYHAVNLLLHVGVVLLLFDLLKWLVFSRAAFAAAVIFAVHPALAEPVNYIFARSILLATLFSVLALRSWTRGERWHAAGWFLLGMLSKEESVALPVFLLWFERWRDLEPLHYCRGSVTPILSRDSHGRVRRLLGNQPLLAMLGIAMVLGVRVLWATSAIQGSQAGSQAGISPTAYFAAEGVVIWRYLFRLFVPWGFSVDYDIAIPPVWLAAAAWVGLIFLAILAVRRSPKLGSWFVGGLILLLPSSSILPASDLAADRRMYLPMVAFAACLGLMLEKVDRRALVVIVLILAGLSARASNLWRTPEALWTEAMERAPSKARPRIQLARVAQPVRALRLLEEAQGLAPEDGTVATEQGRVLLEMARPDEALAAFGRALAIEPNDPRAINNRGAALAALGQPDAARADFERALSRDPCLFDARVNLLRMGVRLVAPMNCRYSDNRLVILR